MKESERSKGALTPSDVAGVALAAIQDLERVIESQKEELLQEEQRIAELGHRLSDLVARVASLERVVRELARD